MDNMAVIHNSFNSQEKILHSTEKLNYFINGGKTLIVTELDLTNRCNNKCPQCIGVNQGDDELTYDEIKSIIYDLKSLGNEGIIISGGGEPLLHKDFIKTLYLIRQHGMKIGVNSNGLALTEESAKAIAETCEYFRVSLDAGTPSMYRYTHGMNEDCFKKVVSNLHLMSSVIKSLQSQISFSTGFLTNLQTIDDMEAFIQISKKLVSEQHSFAPFKVIQLI